MWRELTSFSWRNVPEVLVLAGLLFGLLTVLRGTRGEGMLKTLAGILAFTYIAIRGMATAEFWGTGLQRLTLVLDAVFQASVIALVVIFQPELRRGLALRIGGGLFTASGRERPIIDEVLNAAFVLSKHKIGALIALQRKDALTEYIGSGVTIDAQVKGALLQSIFYVGTPLHDGAVIIQNGRIAAAGCFLPSTDPNNPTIPKTLGARHRAGLGLSEEEDALVVIVSEETGGISLAEGGTLHRDLDREGLLNLLEELFLNDEDTTVVIPLDQDEPGLAEAENPEGGDGKTHTTTRATRRHKRRPAAGAEAAP